MDSSFEAVRERVRRDQAGLSLIELLIASTLMIVVTGAILALSTAAEQGVPRDQERANGLHESAVGVYEMTRDLRLTYSLVDRTPYSFEGWVYQNGAGTHVRYDCTETSPANASWGKCVRTVLGGGSPASTSDVIPYFTNTSASGGPPVFAYTQNGAGKVTYATVHIEVPAKGRLKTGGYSQRTVFDDGVYMRNLDG